MSVFIDAFQRWLRAARYKPDTADRAVRVLRAYFSYSAARNLDPLAQDSVEEFLAGAAGRVRPHTHLNYWKDLRMAFSFAETQGLVARNPVIRIPRPQPSVYERERDIEYTETDVRSLLAVCPHWNWLGIRDRAIVLTLWNCAFRASEICALLVTDVDWDSGEIFVRDGKGGARYSGVMDDELAMALRVYLLRRPHDTATLFTDVHGGLLTRNALLQLLKRLAKRAGWAKPCFPHGFRHSFRANKRELGLDDTDISALLGHKTVRSSHTYGRRAAGQKAKGRLKAVLTELDRLDS